MTDKIKAFKAFNEDMTCRGFQYEVGKTYTHSGTVKECSSGFHACEDPLDLTGYYDITSAKIGAVTLGGDIDRGKSKIAAGEITIDAELSLKEYVSECVKFTFGEAGTNHASSGYGTNHASSGNDTKHASSGNDTKHASSGYGTKHASSGNDTKHASSGDYTKHASSGNGTNHASSGYGTKHASSGYGTKHEANGKNSVIACSGSSSCAKGVNGTWISLAEYVDGRCVGFATGCIGQDGLKENTFYIAKGGKLVEAK